MIIKFCDQSLHVTRAHLRHFPVLVDLNALQDAEQHQQQQQQHCIEIGDADSTLFTDLVYICEASGGADAQCRWLAEQMQTQRAGYICDLFALYCFLGGDGSERCFHSIFNRVLVEASDSEVAHFFGLHHRAGKMITLE